ncbi:acylphosphatase [Chitinophagaceae bacterium LB-8]|uniref:acylphosphatase n=1 Tax=Paraflavisolibacter caeni TaxID=2982496 RepID=A0A9X3B8Z2_9BACT|nr:acylphosphatase [Paraflavisolibacter caeni]MCU7551450.1 acylphosphatase [Paraflavisolibacter caeni]
MATIHLIIKGIVQGVFYRATARDEAEKLGLTGWIKNTPEGYVEAVVNGRQDDIDRYIAWCWKGPSRAKVESVETKVLQEERFDGFQIVRG